MSVQGVTGIRKIQSVSDSQEVVEAKGQVNSFRSKVDTSTAYVEKTTGEETTANQQAETIAASSKALQSSLGVAETSLATAQSELQTAKDSGDDDKISAAQAKVDQLAARKQEIETKLSQAQAESQKASQAVSTAAANKQTALSEQKTAQTGLNDAQAKLQQAKSQAAAEAQKAQAEQTATAASKGTETGAPVKDSAGNVHCSDKFKQDYTEDAKTIFELAESAPKDDIKSETNMNSDKNFYNNYTKAMYEESKESAIVMPEVTEKAKAGVAGGYADHVDSAQNNSSSGANGARAAIEYKDVDSALKDLDFGKIASDAGVDISKLSPAQQDYAKIALLERFQTPIVENQLKGAELTEALTASGITDSAKIEEVISDIQNTRAVYDKTDMPLTDAKFEQIKEQIKTGGLSEEDALLVARYAGYLDKTGNGAVPTSMQWEIPSEYSISDNTPPQGSGVAKRFVVEDSAKNIYSANSIIHGSDFVASADDEGYQLLDSMAREQISSIKNPSGETVMDANTYIMPEVKKLQDAAGADMQLTAKEAYDAGLISEDEFAALPQDENIDVTGKLNRFNSVDGSNNPMLDMRNEMRAWADENKLPIPVGTNMAGTARENNDVSTQSTGGLQGYITPKGDYTEYAKTLKDLLAQGQETYNTPYGKVYIKAVLEDLTNANSKYRLSLRGKEPNQFD